MVRKDGKNRLDSVPNVVNYCDGMSQKKLNQRWVEQLMGLPKNWVKPDEESSNRVDELRMLGNGVVPQTAAKAFITLLKEII